MGQHRLITPKAVASTGLPEDFIAKIDNMAHRRGVSRATILRRLIYKGYKAYQLELAAKQPEPTPTVPHPILVTLSDITKENS